MPSLNSLEPDPSPPPAPEAGGDSTFSIGAIWAGILKNWLLIAGITAVVAIGAAFYTLGQTKIYESSATVLFDPQPLRPLGDRVETVVDTGAGYWTNKEYYKTQYWVIQSLKTTSDVVKSLGLNRDARFIANLPASAVVKAREIAVEDAARILQARLTVEPIRDSRLAMIKYQDADPERARRVVMALVETYIQSNLEDIMDSGTTAADWLHNQLGTLKQDLEHSEIQLHDYKIDKGILSLSMDDQVSMLRDEMQKLNSAIVETRTTREKVRARRDELAKVNPEDPYDVPAAELMQSGALQSLRDAYISAQRQYEGLKARGKGDNHPDVTSVLAQRDFTREALFKEISNIRGALDHDLAAYDRQEGGLKRLFKEAEDQALSLNLLEIEYRRLERGKDNSEKLYSLVMEKSKESDLTRTLMFNNIRVAEGAQLPRGPVSPNVPMNLAGGALAGLILGLAAALGREQLDRSVKTPDQIERLLGLSFLGLLPAFGEGNDSGARYGRREKANLAPFVGAPELVVHNYPSSGIAEAARAVRTNILFMSPDRPYRTLLVTSAGPAEGKTTVACCIAIAIAQAGRRVALLDCDMRRPRLHKVFGQSKDGGMTTALLDEKLVPGLPISTTVPNLSIVTTGPLPPNPAEILHSEAFASLLEHLKSQFDCVVIDSPPVVPVTDAAILSTAVDGTILVVRAFQTTKDLARRAARALRNVGGHVVGTVLNAVDLDRHEYGYKYYYYYKREGYAADEEPGSSDLREPPSATA